MNNGHEVEAMAKRIQTALASPLRLITFWIPQGLSRNFIIGRT